MAEQEIVHALQDILIFLDDAKIAANINRLIGLKLIKPAKKESNPSPSKSSSV